MRRWMKDWNKLNPILADGEVGEIIGMMDTKTGDGKTPWQDLPFTGAVPDYSHLFVTPTDLSTKQDSATAATDEELTDALALKANLASPAFTGTPTVNGQVVEDRTHAAGVYQPLFRQTIALLGDSISAVYLDTTSGVARYNAHSYYTWAQHRLGQRLPVILNAGVSGENTTQVLARVANVVSAAPGWCLVLAGTNDVKQNVSAATIKANLAAIYAALRAGGVRVIAATIPPMTSTTITGTQQAVLLEVNDWIKNYAPPRGHVLVDWFPHLIDPTTGYLKAGNSLDGTHPNHAGAALMGYALAQVLDPLIPKCDVLSGYDDAANLLSNPLFIGNTSGMATSWSIQQTGTPYPPTYTASKVAASDGIAAEWQQLAITVAGKCWLAHNNITTGYAIGDTLTGTVEFQTDSDLAGQVPRLQLTFNGVPGINAVDPAFAAGAVPNPTVFGQRVASGVLRIPPIVVPVGTTSITYAINVGDVTGTVRVRRADLRKVIAYT